MPRNTSGLRRGGGRPKGVPNKATAEVKALAQQYTEDAIEALVSIMQGAKQPPAARVAAAKELLDRGHGRAPQAITGADGGDLALTVKKIVDVFVTDPAAPTS